MDVFLFFLLSGYFFWTCLPLSLLLSKSANLSAPSPSEPGTSLTVQKIFPAAAVGAYDFSITAFLQSDEELLWLDSRSQFSALQPNTFSLSWSVTWFFTPEVGHFKLAARPPLLLLFRSLRDLCWASLLLSSPFLLQPLLQLLVFFCFPTGSVALPIPPSVLTTIVFGTLQTTNYQCKICHKICYFISLQYPLADTTLLNFSVEIRQIMVSII